MTTSATVLALALAAALICGPAMSAQEPETFGASPNELGPIGGGKGYKNVVTKWDYLVKTEDELVDALAKAKPGQVVYVADDAELDFTVRAKAQKFVIEVPGGVTLASGRGVKDSQGGLVYSDEFETAPLIKCMGENVRITGLRIRGPDPKMRWEELPRLLKIGGQELYYKFPCSTGIQSPFPGLEVDNCEISGWSAAGVGLSTGKSHVHHCYIHHCQRRGLGYGVSVGPAEALIEYNLFDHCRHSIACSGEPTAGYEARNNIVEEHGILSSFDVHGGGDRGDGTNIAGNWIKVHHNTFKGLWKGSDYSGKGHCVPAVGIRGVPKTGGEIHHNWFCESNFEKALFKDPDPNVKVYRNQYGPERIVRD